jgi:glutamate-5-semialdehyde dehydrogenase
MRDIGQRARAAARIVGTASAARKSQALRCAAVALRDRAPAILSANAADLTDADMAGTRGAFIDRLRLDRDRLEAIAVAVEEIAALPDPVGRVLAQWERPNGLRFERVATPLGVIGVIFESRPNVTADAGALCLKAGNATVLRAGSESLRTSVEIASALRAGLTAAGLPPDAVQIVPTRDRAAVGLMLAGLDGALDVIVPRGGKSLVARVQTDARVPVFAHLEGICHVYVDAAADRDKAMRIVLNAKLRRTGVCGSAETLLVDSACAGTLLAPLVTMLLDAGCAVRGDAATLAVDARVTPATDEDWRTEYLDAVIACRVVDGLDAAIAHIEQHGSHHTDAIVTEDTATAARFSPRSTWPSCCTMRRHSSPTAGSSASARRSASPRGGCTPGGPSAWNSSPRSSIASVATARFGRDFDPGQP